MKKITILICSMIVIFGCPPSIKLIKSKDLSRFVKTYKYVPFDIPRDGDGVATLVSFDKDGSEAVEAALSDCFIKDSLSIAPLASSLPNYTYVLSKTDSASINTGKIFGEKVNLSAALNSSRIDSVKVEFKDVFQTRVSRYSVLKELKRIKKSNALCVEMAYKKGNYLIERVLGAKEIHVSFYNKQGLQIPVDADVLTEIKAENTYVKNFNGNSILAIKEPRFIGYRLWSINGKPGFNDTPDKLKEITVENTIELKKKLKKK